MAFIYLEISCNVERDIGILETVLHVYFTYTLFVTLSIIKLVSAIL